MNTGSSHQFQHTFADMEIHHSPENLYRTHDDVKTGSQELGNYIVLFMQCLNTGVLCRMNEWLLSVCMCICMHVHP